MSAAKNKDLLHESFYKEKSEGVYNSVAYAEEYFDMHEMVGILKSSVEHITSNDLLPHNPYVSIHRLLSINSVEHSLSSFFVSKGIKGIQLRPTSNKAIEEIRLGQLVLFSSPEFGAQIDVPSIMDLEPIVRDNKMKFSEQVYTAVCGVELLRTKDIRHTGHIKNRLVFRNYVVLEGEEKEAQQAFPKIVYNAVQEVMSSKDMHFVSLSVEPLCGAYQVEETWSRTDIILYKTKLVNHLSLSPFERKEVSINYLRKHNGQYYSIKQKLIPVLDHLQQDSCIEALSLEAYFKGAFLNREGLQYYLSLYTSNANNLKEHFIAQQSSWLIWSFYQQELNELVWNIYYHMMVSRSDSHNVLWDVVSSLLCSPISELHHLVSQLHTVTTLVEMKLPTAEIQSMFSFTFNLIRLNVIQGYNAELFSLKDCIVLLCQKAADCRYLQEVKTSRADELEFVHMVEKTASVLELVILNYQQVVLGFNKTFNGFMEDFSREHQDYALREFDVVVFKDLLDLKTKPKAARLSEEAARAMEMFEVTEKEAKDIVMLNYYKETRLKQNIHDFILDICFESKPEHPLTVFVDCVVQFVFQHQFSLLEERSAESVRESFVVRRSKNSRFEEAVIEGINVFSFSNNLRLFPPSVVGVHSFLENIRIEEKGISVVFSVTEGFLIEDPASIGLKQTAMGLCVDILVRGGLEQAMEVFYRVVIGECKRMEKSRNIGVVGLFSRDKLVKPFDPKNIPSSDQFRMVLGSLSQIILKCVFEEKTLKTVDLTLNLHYQKEGWMHLKQIDPFWEYNRAFFQQKHLETWLQLYPKAQPTYRREGNQLLDINLSMKKWLIHITKQEQTVLAILQHPCERAFQLSRETLNYANLMEYIKNDRTGKFQLKGFSSNFQKHFKEIKNMLAEYSYVFSQGCSTSILEYMQLMHDYYSLHQDNNGEETQLCWLQLHYFKVGCLLRSVSEQIVLHFRAYLSHNKHLEFLF